MAKLTVQIQIWGVTMYDCLLCGSLHVKVMMMIGERHIDEVWYTENSETASDACVEWCRNHAVPIDYSDPPDELWAT